MRLTLECVAANPVLGCKGTVRMNVARAKVAEISKLYVSRGGLCSVCFAAGAVAKEEPKATVVNVRKPMVRVTCSTFACKMTFWVRREDANRAMCLDHGGNELSEEEVNAILGIDTP